MQEWYDAELAKLEERWARELDRWISHIARAIYPLPVSLGYIRSLPFREDLPINVEHSKRVSKLWDEAVARMGEE